MQRCTRSIDSSSAPVQLIILFHQVYEAAWAKSPRSLPAGHTTEWRCTFLFIVVICLEITDLMFAVDSVSAIVAQVPDLYLAYTACVMAMLGLRATFLVIDEFMRLFDYLKYGVALLLVFIGIKLILSKVLKLTDRQTPAQLQSFYMFLFRRARGREKPMNKKFCK